MIHPYSVMFETMSGEERAKLGVTPEMLRLSVGLEDADDLIADLDGDIVIAHGQLDRIGQLGPGTDDDEAVGPGRRGSGDREGDPAGQEGCDDALAEHCEGGQHPPLIHSLYASSGLVPPTSSGHPLNLFLNPILKSPKDHEVNTDFAGVADTCGAPAPDEDPDVHLGCCGLEWLYDDGALRNFLYFRDSLATVGGDTPQGDDDVQVVLGVNPAVLRQIHECLADSGRSPSRGEQALAFIQRWPDADMPLTHWSHTSLEDIDADTSIAWYMGLLYQEGVDWQAPVDSQAEYEMLHEGLAAIWSLAGLSYTVGAGNSLDGPLMLDPEGGWPDDDPSWVRAIRDAPLSVGGEPLPVFYFASAGGMPDIELLGFRKKELFPLDMRQRAALFEMGEDPESWYLGGSAHMVYMPGCSWEMATLGSVAEAGLYREAQKWGLTITPTTWEYIHRYLRRILASSQPEAVKSWYVHIFDISAPSGNFAQNSGVGALGDINVEALERINTELVAPGYARWSTPEEILAEWEAQDNR